MLAFLWFVFYNVSFYYPNVLLLINTTDVCTLATGCKLKKINIFMFSTFTRLLAKRYRYKYFTADMIPTGHNK